MSESAPRRPQSRPLSRRASWAVPGGVAVALAAAVGVPALASADGSDLPDVTPEQLLTRVAEAEPLPVQGTVVYTARLGLPELPVSEMTGADPLNLLGGSSTLRLWSDGADRSRVSLLGATSEYSVVRDGAEAWTYSSTDDAVTHLSLDPADQARYDALAGRLEVAPEADLPTPEQAAAQVLARAEQDSDVSVDAPTVVAGRDAYQLVVSPADAGTLVSRVVVAVDAETSAPLRVQVWGQDDGEAPSLEVGFTDVQFTDPGDAVLAFSAPAGATTEEVVVPLPEVDEAALDAARAQHEAGADPTGMLPPGVAVSGSGWSTVVEVAGLDVAGLVGGEPAALGSVPGAERVLGSDAAQDLIGEFVPRDADGQPGKPSLDGAALYDQLTTAVPEGRLLSTTLLTVLVTDEGRVLAGSVPADVLRAAA